jgi:hypothetical protein
MFERRRLPVVLVALASPVAISGGALWLHQRDFATIPWIDGAMVVFVAAGFVCGTFWRSWWAAGYILGLGLVVGTIMIMLDDEQYDPPATALVPLLFLLILPAAGASVLGVVLGRQVSRGRPY